MNHLIKNESFKEWMISFGKTKATILYIAYLIIFPAVVGVVTNNL